LGRFLSGGGIGKTDTAQLGKGEASLEERSTLARPKKEIN